MIRHRFIYVINHGKPKGSTYILHKARVAILSEDGEDPKAFSFCTGPQKGVKAEEWVVRQRI